MKKKTMNSGFFLLDELAGDLEAASKWDELSVAKRFSLMINCDPNNNDKRWLKLCCKISESRYENLTASQASLVNDLV